MGGGRGCVGGGGDGAFSSLLYRIIFLSTSVLEIQSEILCLNLKDIHPKTTNHFRYYTGIYFCF